MAEITKSELRFQIYFANISIPYWAGISEGQFKLSEESDNAELARAYQARRAIRNSLMIEHGKTDWAKRMIYGHHSELYVQNESEALNLEKLAQSQIGNCELGFQPLRCMHGLVGFLRTINFKEFSRERLDALVDKIYGLNVEVSQDLLNYNNDDWLFSGERSSESTEKAHKKVIREKIYERRPGDLNNYVPQPTK